jgi:hypothetical protein
MSNLDSVIDAVNRYLHGKGLPRMPKVERREDRDSMDELMLDAMRSIWTNPDKEFRESVSVEIAQALKKYSGGKNMEDILDAHTARLDAEEAGAKAKILEEEKAAELERKRSDPNYVPTFEELMGG